MQGLREVPIHRVKKVVHLQTKLLQVSMENGRILLCEIGNEKI